MHRITLVPGREKSVLARHPWIFSRGIAKFDPCCDGDVVQVLSSAGKYLGLGYINRKSQITCRMISFDTKDPKQAIADSIDQALALRRAFSKNHESTCCRLIHAEADFLPGLIVDQYGDSLVLQIGTLGMEGFKSFIVDELISRLKPSWIYEKSNSASRKEEGLKPQIGTLFGRAQEEVLIQENGLSFLVDIIKGQKTGFFLDQQGARALARKYAKDRKVLNCFSYTGGFTLNALAGGAVFADSVDISDHATAMIQKHIEMNSIKGKIHQEFTADVFSFLREDTKQYDFIILDPPAFAKRKSDIESAARGYKDINRLACEKLPSGGLFINCLLQLLYFR